MNHRRRQRTSLTLRTPGARSTGAARHAIVRTRTGRGVLVGVRWAFAW